MHRTLSSPPAAGRTVPAGHEPGPATPLAFTFLLTISRNCCPVRSRTLLGEKAADRCTTAEPICPFRGVGDDDPGGGRLGDAGPGEGATGGDDPGEGVPGEEADGSTGDELMLAAPDADWPPHAVTTAATTRTAMAPNPRSQAIVVSLPRSTSSLNQTRPGSFAFRSSPHPECRDCRLSRNEDNDRGMAQAGTSWLLG